MKSIEEYTDYLFNCNFLDESFDPEDHEDHLKASWDLFDNYDWKDIYPVWREHLHQKCLDAGDVINFVNLYMYYDASAKKIPDPLDFVGYIYYRVDIDVYWNVAGELFDSLAIEILSNHGLVNIMEDPYYSPMKDVRILNKITEYRNREN